LLDEIVVTASRYDEKLTNVPANITIITEDTIKNSTAQNIPDVLRTEGGVQVSDISGNRRNYNVDLRGFGETGLLNTLVLVDGRRINQSDLSGTDWALIPLDRVQRIEIIRGGRGSVLYGDNASGGVINIITKAGDKLKAGADVAAGSYDTYKANAYAGGTLGNVLPFYLSGNYQTSGGYRDNSDTEAKDLGANISYYGIKSFKINVSAGYHKDDNRLPGALKESDFAAGISRTATLNPNDYAKTKDYYLQVTPEYAFSDNGIFKLDASYRKRTFLSYSTFSGGNFLGQSDIGTVAISPRVILKTDLTKVSNNLIVGFDYQKAVEDITNTALFFGTATTGNFTLEKQNYGFYIHDEITIAKDLFVSGGIRKDRADFTFTPSSPDRISMDTYAYTAGINYVFLNKSYVYTTFSRSFRYPVFDELYSFFNNTINTALVPQTSNSYEIGTRLYLKDDIYIHVNLFRTDTDKEIVFNPLTFNNENLDGMTRRNGVEVSFSAKVIDNITVRGSYTYLDAQIKDGMFKGKRVPNVPENKATLSTLYSPFKGFTILLNGVYVGERPFISDFSNDFTNQQGFLVINNKYKYQWKNITAFLDLNNLTNRKYSEYGVIGSFPLQKSYYPSPKRNFFAGLSVEF
jgi:iron complex outermembrane receptor protein